MDFDLLAHHRAIFLLHYDRLHLFLSLVAKTYGDEVTQEVEICPINWSPQTATLFEL